MVNTRRISITFCGGCNPRIDRGQVALGVQEILLASDYQVGYNLSDVDFVIYVSGCAANCAVKYSHSNLPSVVVAADTVDGVAIAERELVAEIVGKVREHFE